MARDPKSGHYDFGGVEVQDVIKAKLTPEQYEGWLLGNIIKYSLRCNFKGQKARDHEKIEFYAKWLGAEVAEKVAKEPEIVKDCETCASANAYSGCSEPEACTSHDKWNPKIEGGLATD